MIILAFDTALNATSVAVVDGARVLARVSHLMDRGHQERLAGIVRETMSEAGVGFESLERIGVTVGPGSFTGLRVGLAFAKGLGLALGVPVVGVGTLQALAASVVATDLTVAAIDARRGQIYFQVFDPKGALMPPKALSLEEAQACLAAYGEREMILVGSGAPLLHANDAALGVISLIDPVAVARLAAEAAQSIERAAPLYLRAPDAKTIAERTAAQ